MLKPESKQAVNTFIESAKEQFVQFADQLSGDTYEQAASIILEAQKNGGRLHHGTEAVHGSCGQLTAGDVVIAISNSGETVELKALSVALQVEQDWDPIRYVRCHPGGALGKLRDNERKEG